MTEKVEDLNAKLEYVYEIYKLSAINTRYYGWRLARTQRDNTILEIVIAVGATGTGAAGLKAVFAGNATLQAVWVVIAGVSALFAIVKPIVQLNKKVETYTKLFTGHNANYYALKDIVVAISATHELTAEQERQFGSIKNRYRELATLDDPSPYQKKVDEIAAEVNRRIPDDTFWWAEPAGARRPGGRIQAPAPAVASPPAPALEAAHAPAAAAELEPAPTLEQLKAAVADLKAENRTLGVEPTDPPVRRPR